jgi:hypothetical protein
MADLARAVAVVQPLEASGEPAVLAHAALSDDALAPHACPLARFCFPEHSEWSGVERAAQLEPAFYTFALTDGAGARSFGHCLRFLPPGHGARYPVVLCLLSTHDWPALYRDLLAALALDVQSALAAGAHDTLLGAACPIRAKLNELRRLQLPPEQLFRLASGPVDADDGAVATLLNRMPAAAVVALFAALLNERRVIVTGERLADVSAGVHACAALLAPLSWQHLFLPVLPASMLQYACAPMPFILGLQSLQLAAVTRLRLPVEKLVILNVDSGIVIGADDDAADLPGAARLQQSVAEATSGATASAALHQFVTGCLGSYHAHIRSLTPSTAAALPHGALRAGPCVFDHAAYVASARSKPLARFRSILRQSQAFEAFITERMEECAAQLPPVQHSDGGGEGALHGVASMLSQARAGYRPLREADAENAHALSTRPLTNSRSWLSLQRRPLGPSNVLSPTPPTALPCKAPLSGPDAENHRALIEAAVQCWQRHVSVPLRSSTSRSCSDVPSAACCAENAEPSRLDAAALLIAQLRHEAAELRLERCAAAPIVSGAAPCLQAQTADVACCKSQG